MPVDRSMKVHNYEKMGEFICRWSVDPTTRPTTIKDLVGQVGPNILTLGADYVESELINWVDIPPADRELTFVIPNKADVQQPVPKGDWNLPDFYSLLAFGLQQVVIDEANKEAFKSSRIADYATAKCM